MGEPADAVSNAERQNEPGPDSAPGERGGLETRSLCLRIESKGWEREGRAEQARSVGAPSKYARRGRVHPKRAKWAGGLSEGGFLCVIRVEKREDRKAEQFAGVYAMDHQSEVIGKLSAQLRPWLLVLRERDRES